MGQSKKYSNTTTLLICMYIYTYILVLCFSKMTYCFSFVWCLVNQGPISEYMHWGGLYGTTHQSFHPQRMQEADRGHLVDKGEHIGTVPPLMTLEMPHRSAGLGTWSRCFGQVCLILPLAI